MRGALAVALPFLMMLFGIIGVGRIGHRQQQAHGQSLLAADVASIRRILDVSVTSLVVAVQAAHADLKAAKGAVLVTNGGFGLVDPGIDALVVKLQSMGLGLGNAAKLKLTRLLAERLRPDGIHVGEVMITGLVKGTAWDDGSATIEPATVAQAFWDLWSRRAGLSVTALNRFASPSVPLMCAAVSAWPLK